MIDFIFRILAVGGEIVLIIFVIKTLYKKAEQEEDLLKLGSMLIDENEKGITK